MRIVIDLDGTICQLRKPNGCYSEVLPLPDAIASLKSLKKQGHEIIIYTARNMKTYNGNTGKVMANIGSLTMDWLKKYDIPYDEILFGKPYGDIYIDDLAVTFTDWDVMIDKIQERNT